jgi:ABC-type Mn2+/Zn2+ transport system permease subunit
MRSTIVLGMAIGLGSVLAGITVAYYANLPPGATTVLVAAATVLLAETWSVVRG